MGGDRVQEERRMSTRVKLPEWWPQALLPLEEVLWHRRSVRAFAQRPLTLQQAAQVLWAAQGVSDPVGLRTAPSAGALYPLEVFHVAGAVEGLTAAVYQYDPQRHELQARVGGDRRQAFGEAVLGQAFIATAPALVVIAAVDGRTLRKYSERGICYVHMQAGHAAQNVCLECTALRLSTVPVGAFHDRVASEALGLALARAGRAVRRRRGARPRAGEGALSVVPRSGELTRSGDLVRGRGRVPTGAASRRAHNGEHS
jgi:SagB-type dehydrogenase family enzyme